MNDTAQEIKSKIDIVEFLKGYMQLTPAGKNFKAVCPFHKEKTPSFMVSPDRQTWHCFGSCGIGGDIFAFLMRYENIEFFEALKILAEKAGVELRRADPAAERQFGVLYDINNLAKNFYQDQLLSSPNALDYLIKRGLKKETVAEFELGFASARTDALTLHLIHKGVNVNDIERSGLAFKSERGGYIDRFRGRIMFPIANHFGKTVGFTGRILPEYDQGTMGKYVNSPETAIFKKSKILYGFHKTKGEVREADEAIMVEGQMDFLMAYQDGVKNIVATSGTALTPDHLTVLRKYAERLVLSFDRDEAGFNAAERAIDLAFGFDFDVRILSIPEPFKDPADAVEKSPGLLAGLRTSAVPAMDFFFSRYLLDNTSKKNLRAVLAKAKKMTSAIDRNLWIKALAERSGIAEKDLAEELGHIPDHGGEGKKAERNPEPVITLKPESRKDLIAENLVALAIAKGDLKKLEPHIEYFPEAYKQAYAVLREGGSSLDPRLNELVNALTLKSGLGLDYDQDELAGELKKEHLKEKREGLLKEIKTEEKKGNEVRLNELMREFDLLSKELHN